MKRKNFLGLRSRGVLDEEEKMTLLSVKDLHVSVDGKQILNGINLEIGEGEIHAVMGPNGSGKSTLSYVLSGREG